MIIEKHISVDGLLTLNVEQIDDHDVLIGFANTERGWHTHAHFLVGEWAEIEADAVRNYVDAILRNQSVIQIFWKGETIVEARVTDDPTGDLDMTLDGTTMEMRYWNGRAWSECG